MCGRLPMDYTTFVQLIANVGFPIACCIALFITLKNSDKNHKEEMLKMTQALEKTTFLLRIYDHINTACSLVFLASSPHTSNRT